MSTQIKIIILLLVLLVVSGFWYFSKSNQNANLESNITQQNIQDDNTEKEFAFQNKGLKTNTAKASISLDKVLDGGPGKDGIPALTNPKFIDIKEAERSVKDEIDGLVVSVGNTVKFYPYSIMVWHEIVNDVVGGEPLVVTFCPLCGSAIVFDTSDQFGVSGKLYESNLLMYDKSTESLWSQSIGMAVVGDRTGEKLAIYPSQVLSFKTFKEKWPNGQVMSTDTGFSRNYELYPYGDYDNNDDIFFPISIKDTRLPAKEIMYVVNAYDHSVAFSVKQLSDNLSTVDVAGQKVTAAIIDGEIIVKDSSGKVLPGYHEMWFSWATHHQEDGVVWKK